jgi:hypothetical protein
VISLLEIRTGSHILTLAYIPIPYHFQTRFLIGCIRPFDYNGYVIHLSGDKPHAYAEQHFDAEGVAAAYQQALQRAVD